jgi:hypothetical protein
MIKGWTRDEKENCRKEDKEERNDCPSSNFIGNVCSHHKQQK